jgi:hypothetical protein
MLTMGRLRTMAPVEPQNWAFPNEKMPPSDATVQYDEFGGAGGGVEGAPGNPNDPEKA